MKERILKILVNAAIGALTSIATIYLGASAAESMTASAAASGFAGDRIAAVVASAVGAV